MRLRGGLLFDREEYIDEPEAEQHWDAFLSRGIDVPFFILKSPSLMTIAREGIAGRGR